MIGVLFCAPEYGRSSTDRECTDSHSVWSTTRRYDLIAPKALQKAC